MFHISHDIDPKYSSCVDRYSSRFFLWKKMAFFDIFLDLIQSTLNKPGLARHSSSPQILGPSISLLPCFHTIGTLTKRRLRLYLLASGGILPQIGHPLAALKMETDSFRSIWDLTPQIPTLLGTLDRL